MCGGGQEEHEEALQALGRGIKAVRVSVSMLCEHWKSRRKLLRRQKPVGQTKNSWLELVGSVFWDAPGGGRG